MNLSSLLSSLGKNYMSPAHQNLFLILSLEIASQGRKSGSSLLTESSLGLPMSYSLSTVDPGLLYLARAYTIYSISRAM